MTLLTPSQFEALTRLHKTKSPAAQEACRLVMVEGIPLAEAARQAGISTSAANNAHKRLVERLEWCKIATKG